MMGQLGNNGVTGLEMEEAKEIASHCLCHGLHLPRQHASASHTLFANVSPSSPALKEVKSTLGPRHVRFSTWCKS